MNIRNVFMAIALVLFSGRLAAPESFAAFTINRKPPSVVVQDNTGKVVATIPVGANPEQYIFSKSSNTLYVVHEAGGKKARFISAVNLVTKRVDREIKVGAGRPVTLLISKDGHRLYCNTAGAFYGPIKPGFNPPFEPVITVIDTRSNDVIATYDWFGGLHAAFPEANDFASSFFLTRDEEHLIAVSLSRWTRGNRTLMQHWQVAAFSGLSPRPAVTIDSGEEVQAMLSVNQRLLFVVGGENAPPSAVLHIVDLQAGTVVNHVLNDRPAELIRLGSEGGIWVSGGQEMRPISETGELGVKPILLNKPRKLEAGDEGGATAFLNGYPGETISLGEDHAAILIIPRDGKSSRRVALLDLKQLQVDSIVVTLSAAELKSILAGRALGAAIATIAGAALAQAQAGMNARSMASTAALANAAAGRGPSGIGIGWAEYNVYEPNLNLTNELLAARPDGRYLYTLDPDGNKVTVIDVQVGSAVSRIRVHGSVSQLQVSPDGKYLLLLDEGKTIQKIDLETNNLEK